MEPQGLAAVGGVPAINSYDDLKTFLKQDIGFCGCAYPTDALATLRDVLQLASDFQDGCRAEESSRLERCTVAYRALQVRLDFERMPGLATWFLYMLDQKGLIYHSGNVTECAITPKGSYVLSAIKQFPAPA